MVVPTDNYAFVVSLCAYVQLLDNGQVMMDLVGERIAGTRKFSHRVDAGEYYIGVRNLDECTFKTPNKKIEAHILIQYPDGSSEERMSPVLKCMFTPKHTHTHRERERHVCTYACDSDCAIGVVCMYVAPEPWKERFVVPINNTTITLSVIAARGAVCLLGHHMYCLALPCVRAKSLTAL
jgi:hypothetical protein